MFLEDLEDCGLILYRLYHALNQHQFITRCMLRCSYIYVRRRLWCDNNNAIKILNGTNGILSDIPNDGCMKRV